jgi:hypothetical protein
MTRKPESKRVKTYEIYVQRTLTYATEGATIRVQAANQTEAENIAESLYNEGGITFDGLEVQECSMAYTAEELTPEARIARLMLTIRQISAATTGFDTEEVIATIQGFCKDAVELEKQASAEQGNTP